MGSKRKQVLTRTRADAEDAIYVVQESEGPAREVTAGAYYASVADFLRTRKNVLISLFPEPDGVSIGVLYGYCEDDFTISLRELVCDFINHYQASKKNQQNMPDEIVHMLQLAGEFENCHQLLIAAINRHTKMLQKFERERVAALRKEDGKNAD